MVKRELLQNGMLSQWEGSEEKSLADFLNEKKAAWS